MGKNNNPLKGLFFPHSRGRCAIATRRKTHTELLKRKNTYTPELETPKKRTGQRKRRHSPWETFKRDRSAKYLKGESNREGAIKGVKYDFVRFP